MVRDPFDMNCPSPVLCCQGTTGIAGWATLMLPQAVNSNTSHRRPGELLDGQAATERGVHGSFFQNNNPTLNLSAV
jgi:hypothetical protein